MLDSEVAFEKAHREAPENRIRVGTSTWVLDSNSKLRVLGKRLDVGQVRLNGGDAEAILSSLVDGPERAALLADLAADRGAQARRRAPAPVRSARAEQRGPVPGGLQQRVPPARRGRRERAAIKVLAKLAADGAPLAAAIRASKPWGEVAAHARADRSRPGLSDLRLARLLGDAALEARAKVVLDDKLARASAEFAALLDPGNPTLAEDLAYLDRR